MKTTTKILLATVAASAFGISSANALVATANANIVAPLSIGQTTALSFGSFSSSPTAGTITSGGAATGGVVTLAPGNDARFNTVGTANATYTAVVDPTATLSNGAATMTAALTVVNGHTFSAAGADTFPVSGILSVPANQPLGAYTGTYNINIHY